MFLPSRKRMFLGRRSNFEVTSSPTGSEPRVTAVKVRSLSGITGNYRNADALDVRSKSSRIQVTVSPMCPRDIHSTLRDTHPPVPRPEAFRIESPLTFASVKVGLQQATTSLLSLSETHAIRDARNTGYGRTAAPHPRFPPVERRPSNRDIGRSLIFKALRLYVTNDNEPYRL